MAPLRLSPRCGRNWLCPAGRATRLAHLYQTDPLRVLFPTPEAGDPVQAAIVTTSGGLVAGDRIDITVRVDLEAKAHVTASASEKIYRSPHRGHHRVRQELTVGDGGVLEFLPPETILFDGARLRRETLVDLGPGGSFSAAASSSSAAAPVASASRMVFCARSGRSGARVASSGATHCISTATSPPSSTSPPASMRRRRVLRP